jgi:hypothetical protein
MRLISLSITFALAATAACAQQAATAGSPSAQTTAAQASTAKPAAPKTRRVCVVDSSVNSRIAKKVCHTEVIETDPKPAADAAASPADEPATPAG